jgi:hypothetical protein
MANAKAKEGKKVPALGITAKRDGFRRAGHEWSGTTYVDPEALSPEQIKQLSTEPLLVVHETEVIEDQLTKLG